MDTFLKQLFTYIYNIVTAPIEIGETSVSLSSIVKLILCVLAVIFLTRALKNFLKKYVLTRMGIDEGNREAISTIISYGMATLGFIVVLQTSGFNIASLAVIAGGLGVGIGFGLQDITKNFVSGLTLLVERKLKLGDFIEFDGMSGYIKEISIRSTIIRTFPGGDVVVPNSELVNNRILNWSYENFMGRIDIPIGVAYASDPVLVTETLLKSAYMEPAVLREPPPRVLFLGFGDNSLDFLLWVWVGRIDDRITIKSSLNFIIDYNFRQQGIHIPFPQRDLWLRNPEVLNGMGAVAFRDPEKQQEDGGDVPQFAKPQLATQIARPLAIKDLLRQVTYFQNFTDLELRQLIEVGYRKRLAAGEILFREGDPGDAFYIVLSGSVEVFVAKINKHLTTLTTGQFLGELALMLGIPRTATVRAVEDTILFAITKKGFEKTLQSQPELYDVIVQELGKHKEELAQRQKQLREMGLVNEDEDDKNPIDWMRKRLKNLFNLQ
ncbi:cyclic nucleotide-binding domain-containing protein [Aerosakkonema funiforme]|uniref:cyclic nucleotide-binding domain-containing protein n=1 Tax=Aerosakkonema funiforme TaxID=1246630 RepID=UPI0035B9F3D3